MSIPPSFNTVTKLSKTIALILFIALPFIGFNLGLKYQKSLDRLQLETLNTQISSLKLQNIAGQNKPVKMDLGIKENIKTFRDKVNGIELSYPDKMREVRKNVDGTTFSYDTTTYIPLCNYPNPNTSILCLFLDPKAYPNSNFEGANVHVAIVDNANTSEKCTNLISSYVVDSPEIARHVTINGISYLHGYNIEGAAGHYLRGEVYIAFHNNKCFTAFTGIGTTTYENYPEGTINKFTDEQAEEVNKLLNDVVQSLILL